MKPSLQVRLSQHLALTPQLQQSIRLLQLSTLELHQEVEQMLEQNPFIELDEDAASPFEASLQVPAERSNTAERTREADEVDGRVEPDDPAGMDSAELGATERDDWSNGTEGDDFDGIRETPSSAAGADDDFEPQERGPGDTLADHLRRQLLGMRLSPEDAAAVMALIESLDDDGYLADTPDDLAAELAGGDEHAREELADRLRCALKWLQSMEPAGVGARDLSECLQLQLRQREPGPAREVALAICARHLDLLARRDLRRLTTVTGADEALVKQAQALIVTCEPKPGRPFA